MLSLANRIAVAFCGSDFNERIGGIGWLKCLDDLAFRMNNDDQIDSPHCCGLVRIPLAIAASGISL